MVLFVELFETHHRQLALLHFVDALHDLVETDRLLARTDIGAARDVGDLGQHLLVELRNDHVALLVLDEFAADLNRGAFGRADADGVNPYAHLRGVPCGRQCVVLVVLAVGDEDDDAAVVLLGFARKRHQGLRQRLADGRALHRHQRRVDALGEGLGHAVVRGDRQLHLRLPGEDDQPDAVLMQTVEELVDGVFGPLQPVGFEIFGQHRVRDVYGQHHLDALRLLLAEFRPELRACRRQYEQRDRRAEEDEFERHAPGRNFGHQLFQYLHAPEALQPLAAVARRQPEEQDQRGYDRQQPEILRICESKHCKLRFTVFFSAPDSRTGTPARAAPDPPAPRAGTARGR